MNEGFPDKWLSPKVEIFDSPIHGKGMRALTGISEGERIVVWSGDCYTDREGAERAKAEGKATMQWDDDVFSIETSEMEDIFRINHSCDPNTWMKDAFTLVAMRDINVGEEVLVDYGLMIYEEGFAEWDCSCGSDQCRGKISTDDWKDPLLQERYRGHFTPWLNKMIERL